ncbi:hypothetical protein ASPWEDRAFT_37964 [Aspergillus wentii DTO 134E9]|uniref:Uncharacterized protein n=1 Tax=Aspergillus wentii DTO 134E9 TaxID=1073089 RepID=A0A1L9RN82_ASPWE|nr:uncharacterized protein ASPWEDRAFT_37964 [Aspergillus wentii DTO 134E9]KAI9926058.1 hypothetical protein MW887_004517 [Aspergillus wentii]OJJ36400.1 hypothetical protein ASPWEDRAFT_37964 [Aspergillus wentii DTO 134E9]
MQYKSLALAAALSGVALAAPAHSDTTTAAYTDFTGTATASADWTNTAATPSSTPSSKPIPPTVLVEENKEGQCRFRFYNALGCNGESSPFGVKGDKGECVSADDETAVNVPVCDGSAFYFFKDKTVFKDQKVSKGDVILSNNHAIAQFHLRKALPGYFVQQAAVTPSASISVPHSTPTPTPSFSPKGAPQ